MDFEYGGGDCLTKTHILAKICWSIRFDVCPMLYRNSLDSLFGVKLILVVNGGLIPEDLKAVKSLVQ